jgi:hypothetical protein
LWFYPAGLLEDEKATTLLKLLADVDLKDTISGEGPYTMFAPTNEAFAKLDPNLVTTLTQDTELLKSVLQYHLVPRKLYSKNFLDDTILATTLEGNFLRMSKAPCGGATVNGAEVNLKKFDQVIKRAKFGSKSQSYQTLISSFFRFSLLSLAILKYRQYFLMQQTLKLNNKKKEKSSFYEEKSLVGLTPV